VSQCDDLTPHSCLASWIFLGTDHLHWWGSGEGVLKLLRNKHVVNTRPNWKVLAHRSGPHFVVVYWRFLTGIQDRTALFHLTPSVSPFEVEHCMPLVLCLSEACWLGNIETKGVLFPTPVFILDLHESILKKNSRLFFPYKLALVSHHSNTRQISPVRRESQLTNEKVIWKSAGQQQPPGLPGWISVMCIFVLGPRCPRAGYPSAVVGSCGRITYIRIGHDAQERRCRPAHRDATQKWGTFHLCVAYDAIWVCSPLMPI
jgi:hypothetical protein